jgi:hypothetical protein
VLLTIEKTSKRAPAAWPSGIDFACAFMGREIASRQSLGYYYIVLKEEPLQNAEEFTGFAVTLNPNCASLNKTILSGAYVHDRRCCKCVVKMT